MPDYTLHEAIFMTLSLLWAVVVGLAAIWIALGRGHWFVRVAVVGACLAPLVLVPAFDLLVVPVLQLLLAVPPLAVARRLRARAAGQPAWQFSLRDLLLLTLVVAVLAAVGASAPRAVWRFDNIPFGVLAPFGLFIASWRTASASPWLYTLSFAAAMAAATWIAAWIVLGRKRRRARCIAALVILAGLCFIVELVHWRHRFNPSQMATASQKPEIYFPEILISYAFGSSLLAILWLGLYRASGHRRKPASDTDATAEKDNRRWLRIPARAGLLLLTFVLVAPLVTLYAVLLTRPAIPKTTLPNPNGYTRLVALGKQLEKVNVPVDNSSNRRPGVPQFTPQDYVDFARQHRELLLAARAAVGLPSLVPVSYDIKNLDARVDDCMRLRQLARAMQAAAEAARIQGDRNEAFRWHVSTLRLGRCTARGGLGIEWAAGRAVEGMGQRGLHEDLTKLPAERRAELVSILHALGEEAEPLETIQHRDDVWSQRAYGCLGRLVYCISELAGQNQEMRDWSRDAESRFRALHRILLVELALEAYRDRHGQYPDRLDSLVPDQLPQLPLDPFTDKPLRYWSTFNGGAYCVYSVGPNRQDDDGKIRYPTPPGPDDVRFE